MTPYNDSMICFLKYTPYISLYHVTKEANLSCTWLLTLFLLYLFYWFVDILDDTSSFLFNCCTYIQSIPRTWLGKGQKQTITKERPRTRGKKRYIIIKKVSEKIFYQTLSKNFFKLIKKLTIFFNNLKSRYINFYIFYF